MQIAESMGLSEAWTNPMSASKLTSQDPTAIEKEQQRLKEQERTIAPPTVVIVATPAPFGELRGTSQLWAMQAEMLKSLGVPEAALASALALGMVLS
jgi:hypothetical protein